MAIQDACDWLLEGDKDASAEFARIQLWVERLLQEMTLVTYGSSPSSSLSRVEDVETLRILCSDSSGDEAGVMMVKAEHEDDVHIMV